MRLLPLLPLLPLLLLFVLLLPLLQVAVTTTITDTMAVAISIYFATGAATTTHEMRSCLLAFVPVGDRSIQGSSRNRFTLPIHSCI